MRAREFPLQNLWALREGFVRFRHTTDWAVASLGALTGHTVSRTSVPEELILCRAESNLAVHAVSRLQ